MTTFTVLNRHGEVQTQNASLSEAAQTVLWHDGHDYEFRADGDWLELWVTPFSRNSQLGGRPLVRAADMRAPLSSQKEMADDEIFSLVIDHASRWNDCSVMTDDDYRAMTHPCAIGDRVCGGANPEDYDEGRVIERRPGEARVAWTGSQVSTWHSVDCLRPL